MLEGSPTIGRRECRRRKNDLKLDLAGLISLCGALVGGKQLRDVP
jgi:hypothetical protein